MEERLVTQRRTVTCAVWCRHVDAAGPEVVKGEDPKSHWRRACSNC